MSKQTVFQLEKDQAQLRVLVSSDVHAKLLDYNYSKDQPSSNGSLARLATMIAQYRQTSVATLVVDNGDFLQGSAIADAGPDVQGDAQNPVIAAMNHVGYDVVGLGNHEFNLESGPLRAALLQAQFPVLCANLKPVDDKETHDYSGLWRPNCVLQVATQDGAGREVTLAVGVFGVLPPQVVEWDSMRVGGALEARDIVDVAREQARELKLAGADLVIALAHSGISTNARRLGMENAAVHVAALEDVDAIVAGHIHMVFPGPEFADHPAIDAQRGTLNGTPAVMPGAWASHLGQIDLLVERHGAGWRVKNHVTQILPGAGQDGAELPPQDPGLVALLAPAHQATLAHARRIIGALQRPVTSYFAMVRDDCSSRVVAEAKLAHIRAELKGGPLADLPLIASTAPMKCGGRAGAKYYIDIAPGPVESRAVEDMQPYSNYISLLRLTGAQILEWLEVSASLYNQMVPGAPEQMLFDRDAPAYNREAVYGLSYAVDVSQPARYGKEGGMIDDQARRVRDVTYQSEPLRHDQEFLLITNDYRGGGGGNFPILGPDRVVPVQPVRVRDVLSWHLENTSGRPDPEVASWRLHPLPGVQAMFDTGAGAKAYVQQSGLAVSPVGAVDNGFWRYRIDLTAKS